MATKYVDLSTVKFFMNEVQEIDTVLEKERYQDHDRESIDLFLDSVKQFADKELFPYFKDMDEQPAKYKEGSIEVHPQVEKMMKEGGAMGLIAAPFNYEDGGLQIPLLVNTAACYVLDAANNHLPGYAGLTSGAAELIIEFGSESLKINTLLRCFLENGVVQCALLNPNRVALCLILLPKQLLAKMDHTK